MRSPSAELQKSPTDLHWHRRAQTIHQDRDVNIQDVFQRDLEFDFICPHLDTSMRVLEVGCGNGYSTAIFRKHCGYVDAFDQSEAMIARARVSHGEINNRFLVDNVLDPRHIDAAYDAVLCVRVLINLRNYEEQCAAIRQLQSRVRRGGTLVLVEGFTDGFSALNGMRARVGLPNLSPASINYYSGLADLMPLLESHFEITHHYHLGAYDYLTRVAYPLLVGPDNVTHNTVWHDALQRLAKAFNPDDLKALSRIRGFVLRRTS